MNTYYLWLVPLVLFIPWRNYLVERIAVTVVHRLFKFAVQLVALAIALPVFMVALLASLVVAAWKLGYDIGISAILKSAQEYGARCRSL